MRVSGDGWPPPSGAGGMPGGTPGGMPGGSRRLERGKLVAGREAAELASEAARAEGASIPGTRTRERWVGSGMPATSFGVTGGDLASGAHQAEQAGPLLGIGGDQQPHRRSAASASEPRGGPLAVPVVGGEARDRK